MSELAAAEPVEPGRVETDPVSQPIGQEPVSPLPWRLATPLAGPAPCTTCWYTHKPEEDCPR